jgi:heme-degrading monooxygenase HmoA
MLARVINGQTTSGGLDKLILFAAEQLPGIQSQPGFKGFYLLTDRDTGGLVTISLWDTWEDIRALEAQAAQLTHKATESIEAPPTSAPVKIYEVGFAALA